MVAPASIATPKASTRKARSERPASSGENSMSAHSDLGKPVSPVQGGANCSKSASSQHLGRLAPDPGYLSHVAICLDYLFFLYVSVCFFTSLSLPIRPLTPICHSRCGFRCVSQCGHQLFSDIKAPTTDTVCTTTLSGILSRFLYRSVLHFFLKE